MPYDLPLPKSLKQWKVKALDRELRYEEPHITIRHKRTHWRWGLRSRDFLDIWPDPRRVSAAVLDEIRRNYNELVAEWNRRFPNNPV